MTDPTPPWRKRKGDSEGRLAWLTGLTEAWRLLGPNRRAVVVLNYHKVERAEFAEQLDALLSRWRAVSLGEAVAYAADGRPRGEWRFAVTFDDGAADFLEGAYPELVARGVPATVYSIPGLMGQVPFWERVDAAFAGSAAPEFRWAGRTWDHSPGRRAARTRKAILHALKRLTDIPRREDLVAELETALAAVRRPDPGPPPLRLMTWEETARLDPKLIDIGGHSQFHPSLGRAEPEVLRREVADCRRVLRERLGREVRDYCYPYGRRVDVSRAAAEATRQAGYRSAVTSITGFAGPGVDLYRIPRVGFTGREPPHTVAARMTGVGRIFKSAEG